MSIHSGAMAVARFRILGGKDSYKFSDLNPLLMPWQASAIKLDGIDKEEQFGWDRPTGVETDRDEHSPVGTDGDPWDMSHCQIADGYILRIRLERRKVPASLFQILFKQRLNAIAAKTGKMPPRPERARVKEELKRKLLERALPTLSYIDVFWNETHREIQVFSGSVKALTVFEELFYKTFAEPLKLAVVKIDPPLLGISRAEWENGSRAGKTVSKFAVAVPASLV